MIRYVSVSFSFSLLWMTAVIELPFSVSVQTFPFSTPWPNDGGNGTVDKTYNFKFLVNGAASAPPFQVSRCAADASLASSPLGCQFFYAA